LASEALLSLTYYEKDRDWLQKLLMDLSSSASDPQMRRLAITCLGHVARLDGAILDSVPQLLRGLQSDPDLGGTAEDALGDVASFVKKTDMEGGG
jgi:hypothetical protein